MISHSQKFFSHQEVAMMNKQSILDLIKDYGPISRTDIWKSMELSRASVSTIINELISEGLIFEKGTEKSGGGRKPTLLQFNYQYKYVLAFDWFSKSLTLLDLNAVIMSKTSVDIYPEMSPQSFTKCLSLAVKEILGMNQLETSQILGLGLIMVGVVDPVAGKIVVSILQKWENVNLIQLMQTETNLNVIVENDTNMRAVGEYYYGVGKGIRKFAVLSVIRDENGATGLGTTLFLGDNFIRGAHNVSGEIGHVRINKNGPICLCGKRGCIEAYLRESIQKGNNNWIGEATEYLGMAIGIIYNILDPEIVVLCGNVVDRFSDVIMSEIKVSAMENILTSLENDIQIVQSKIESATVKGMSRMIYNIYFNEKVMKKMF
jgi:predicted NBD/HSP70 family sugar kinase